MFVVFRSAAAGTQAAATITIFNMNAAGEGFNDPTPVAPVGGNAGTRLGRQRLIALQHAADIWGATLTSTVPVRVAASFVSLSCTASSAVLGSAGAHEVYSDFPGAIKSGTWYPGALASKLAGADQSAPSDPHIVARFNSRLGLFPDCLPGSGFYLGLDDNFGAQIDLVSVLLHEMAHGLGFQAFTDDDHRHQLADCRRAAQRRAERGVADMPAAGPDAAPLTSSVDIGDSTPGTAAVTRPGRGVCTFVEKAKNVQNAGAIAMVVADNAPGDVTGLGGADPTIVIPAVRMSQVAGVTLKAALTRRARGMSGVIASLGVNPAQLAGADASNRIRMYSPTEYSPGSSVSHYSTDAKRNQLMEPSINTDLVHSVTPPVDLTYTLLKDICW